MPEGWSVTYADKPVKTSDGTPLMVPTEGLAEAIAEEWRAQDLPKKNTGTMPLYRIACMALDYTTTERQMVEDELCRFAQSDTLCYQVEYPEQLATLQMAEWQPLVKWAGELLGAPFHITCTVTPLPEDPALEQALRAYITPMDTFTLAGLLQAARLSTSIIIATALKEQKLDASIAWRLAYLEEQTQQEIWGADEEAAVRLEDIHTELQAVERYFSVL